MENRQPFATFRRARTPCFNAVLIYSKCRSEQPTNSHIWVTNPPELQRIYLVPVNPFQLRAEFEQIPKGRKRPARPPEKP